MTLAVNMFRQLQWDKQSRSYSMNEYINEFVCMYMSSKGIDWYNNDGGSGTFTFENGETTCYMVKLITNKKIHLSLKNLR